MKANFVGLELSNSSWNILGKVVKDTLLDYINLEKLSEFNNGSIYETQPHITLIYNESLNKGPNWLDWFITIKHRDLYKELVTIGEVSVPKVTINTFNNPDSRVLKFSLVDCNILDICRQYNTYLNELPLEESTYKIYKPHLTITYLKPDTPDKVIEDFKSKLILNDFQSFKLENILISNSESEFKIKIE